MDITPVDIDCLSEREIARQGFLRIAERNREGLGMVNPQRALAFVQERIGTFDFPDIVFITEEDSNDLQKLHETFPVFSRTWSDSAYKWPGQYNEYLNIAFIGYGSYLRSLYSDLKFESRIVHEVMHASGR